MGILGGGSGGGGGGQAIDAIKQGTQQGVSALQEYYSKALPALNNNYGNAQNYMAPYSTSGANALDELYDTLGVKRPEAGSYPLQQALMNYDALNARANPDPSKHFDISSLHDATGINFMPGQFQADATAQAKQAGGYMFNQSNGELYTSMPGTGRGGDVDEASLGVRGVRGANGLYSLEQIGNNQPLTAAEQAQLDLANKYKAGTLGMTSGDNSSILAQLQQSPGYQFNLSQGLQGVDRSKAAQGLLGSGSAIKGATQYAQGLAENTYNNRIQQLMSAAGMGQQAGTQQGNYSAGLGTGLANLAQGMGANTASLYGAQAQGLAQAYAGQQAANASSSGSLFSAIGSIAGAAAPYVLSDRRLKKDIEQIGELPNGLPLYTFKYTMDDTTTHVGVMSDDVKLVMPEAVGSFGGYDVVDYGKIMESK